MHPSIARVKPFLSPAKVKHKDWGETYYYWTQEDWQDVIWSDEGALSVGQVPGNVWVAGLEEISWRIAAYQSLTDLPV